MNNKGCDEIMKTEKQIGDEIIKMENGIGALRIRQKEEPNAPYLRNQIDDNRQRIKALQWVLVND